MDGVLLIDKPQGPTSHDVVARIRSVSGERSIGHTGTLDPRASGLLPLVLGRATRLASLLSGSDKTYEATVQLGTATDTDDADGDPIGEASAERPDDETLERALSPFRGTYAQMPPNHSAKKVNGARAYDLARRAAPVVLTPATVTVKSLLLTGRQGDLVHLVVRASAGFYVRALARDLGIALGCGAHLASLRRTQIDAFTVAAALPLEEAERLGAAVADRLLTPAQALPGLSSVEVNELGLKRVLHGNPLGPGHLVGHSVPPPTGVLPVKIMAPDGRLIALGHSRGGALHPAVVLG